MKKMITRRNFLQATASLAAVSALAACGDTSTSTSTAGTTSTDTDGDEAISGTVKFLTNRTDLDLDGTFAGYIASFNETYPDVTINVESMSDYVGEMAIRMQTTEYGDVCMIPDAISMSDLPSYFEPLGAVEDYSDIYVTDYLYHKWYNEQVYGFINMCVVKGVVYNKQVFADAGITTLPATEEEFLAALKAIKDNTDAIPYYTNMGAGWPLSQWYDHASGSIMGDADYKYNGMITDEIAFAEGGAHYSILKLISDIVTEGLCEADPTTTDWESSKGMLNRGEIGCMVLGNWAVTQLQAADEHPDDVGYMPYPHTIDGERYNAAGGDYAYGINVNSKNKAAARAWIDFMVNESGFAVSNGGISVLQSDPLPDGLENFEGVTLVVDFPATTENDGVLDEMQYASGVTLDDNGSRMATVIDIARGASKDTFESFTQSLNDAWVSAM